jgi:sec-independent protein translocase protein TatC
METEDSGNKLSFLGHLEELRWRLVKSAVAVLLFSLVIFLYTEPIMDHVFISMSKTNFPTYRLLCFLSNSMGMDDTLCASEIKISLQSTAVTGQFSTNIYFAILGGISIAFPFIFYQIYGFIKPGLNHNELKYSKGVVFFASLLFLFGIAFGYFVLSPLCVQFFGNYSMSSSIKNDFTIDSYMSIITRTTFYTGIFFQLPIASYILTKLGLITPVFMRKFRKHALVGILVLSAILTPPDIISQIIVAVPVYGLYEIGILVSASVLRRKTN